MRDYGKALAAGYPPGLLTSDGGITGNPADFIVDESGRIVSAHYGRHNADSLDAPDVAAALRAAQWGLDVPARRTARRRAVNSGTNRLPQAFTVSIHHPKMEKPDHAYHAHHRRHRPQLRRRNH